MVNYKDLGLVNTKELFANAIKGGYAIPAFNFNNLEQMQAIISACVETKSPVILQVSSGARKYANQTLLRYLAQGAVQYAKELAKPFIWQPYIQEENTHLIKLQAWLERTPFTPTIQQLIEAWNQSLPLASALDMALDQYPTWQQQCRQYASDLAQQTDLARQLVAFCSQIAQNKVK